MNNMLKQNTSIRGWVFAMLCTILGVYQTSAQAPYCAVSGFTTAEEITLVNIANINNSSPNNNNVIYENFTSIVGNVTAGQSYTMTLKGNTEGNFTCSFHIYIDWNNDNDFLDANEYYSGGTIVNSTGLDAIQAVSTIAVPASALVANHRMRVLKKFTASTPSPNDGCTSGSSFGTYEDYTLAVAAAPPPPPGSDTCYLVCPENMTITLDPGACEAYVHYNITAVGDSCGLGFSGTSTISQMVGTPDLDDALDYFAADARHYRAYTAQASLFQITGMQVACWTPGQQKISVYAYTGPMGGTTLTLAAMTLLGETGFMNVTNGINNLTFATPIVVPAGQNFVVMQQKNPTTTLFIIGSTYNGQTAPGYIGLPNTNPGTYASLGYSYIHLVQVLNIQFLGNEIVQTSGLPSGSAFPIGTTTNCFEVQTRDGEVLASCCFDVVVQEYPNPIASLACNDLVNISVDTNCTATITADMILEGGPYGCYDSYIVALGENMTGPFNLGNVVTCQDIGKTYAAQVTDPRTGNRCWGWVKIEDKLAPTIDCDGCVAEQSEFTGRLQYGVDPTGDWSGASACWNFSALVGPYPGIHPYDKVGFRVPITGAYTFDLHTDADQYDLQGYMGIFTAPFNPSSPCDNLIDGVDEIAENFFGTHSTVTINLTTGVDYEFVLIDYGITDVNNYDWVVNITGPGGVGVLAIVPCEIQCTDLAGLLGATTLTELEDLGIGTAIPVITDNCNLAGCPAPSLTFSVGTPTSSDPCDPERYVPITWTATDLGGNTATCVENIYINVPDLAEVIFPDAVIVNCGADPANEYAPDFFNAQAPDASPFSPAYNPDAVDGNTTDEDWPAINDRDIKTNEEGYCKIVSTYTDQEILICGANSYSRKIIRRWTVVDWCSQSIREGVQLIKVMDNTAPSISCPAPLTVNASPWTCDATGVVLPAASVSDACTIDASLIPVTVSLNGTVILNTNGGRIPAGVEVPVGTHTLVYTATDPCGNTSTCSTTLTVMDNTPPNAICKEFLQVTVNPNGCINKIPANRFDNGSYDNCCADSDLRFKVRRMADPNDSWFRDTLSVGFFSGVVMYNNGAPLFGTVNNSRESRNDLTGIVTGPYGEKFCGRVDVIMRVYCVGSPNLYSDCMVQVFVDDKTRPVITAPASLTVHCEDYPNQNHATDYDRYFGTATWADPCGALTVDTSITGSLDDCGEGVLVKTWRVTDKCGNSDVKSQTVTVKHISDFIVTFPQDTMIFACVDTQEFTPIPHDPIWWPKFEHADCENLATTWWDERFYGENDACFKIFRHWKVINWCAYDIEVGNTNDDYIAPSWQLPSTCKYRASTFNQFTSNDCSNWRPGVYRRIQDGGEDASWYRGDGVVEYVQVIKVKDNENPVVQVINPKPCPVYPNGPEPDTYSDIPTNTSQNNPWVYPVIANSFCLAPAGTLKSSAVDCSSRLNYHWEVDAEANATVKTVDFYGQGPVINVDLPLNDPTNTRSVHRVYWEVNDGCGNVARGNYWVRLVDCKKPSPVCYHGLATVVMPSSGSISLPARYFDAGSFDNCPAGQLWFSYTTNDLNDSYDGGREDSIYTWTCDDIIANGGPRFEVRIVVTDEYGNADTCTTYLEVQDPHGVCGDVPPTAIRGTVTTYVPVEGIKDVVISYGGNFAAITNDATGKFEVNTNLTGTNKLEGKHDKDFINGVNVGDIVKIQNHILGKVTFDQPYKYLAADVNESKSISIQDIIEIRKLILGKVDKFSTGKSWRTFDETYPLSMSNWTETPEYVMADAGSTNVNLKGVKVGDVDLSAKANINSGTIENRSVGTLSFRAEEAQLVAGQTIEVPVRAKDFTNIAGYQMTLNFNQNAMEFAGMKPGALNLTSEDFGTDHVSEGILTTIWNESKGVTVDNNEVLFTLVFNAKADVSLSSVLTANSKLTTAMAVNSTNDQMDVNLEFTSNTGVVASGQFELMQNTPNPFSSVTNIKFNLPEAGKAVLTVYDVTGKVVYSNSIDAAKGLNELTVNKNQLGTAGVLFYQLVAGDYSATKKMVIVE